MGTNLLLTKTKLLLRECPLKVAFAVYRLVCVHKEEKKAGMLPVWILH